MVLRVEGLGRLTGWQRTTLISAVLALAMGMTNVSLAAPPMSSLTVAYTQDISYIDPGRGTFLNERAVLHVNLYDHLMIRNKDGRLVPWLAESWQRVSPTSWEFKLHKGVKFHNGEPFNAQAVKFTVDRLHEKGKLRFTQLGDVLEGAEVVDDYTVRIMTRTPDALLIHRLWEMPIVPPRYIREVGDDGFLKKPVGTGPYKWVEWVKGSHFTLEANPDYWRGAPKVQRVTFKLIPEIATRVAALKAGEADIVFQLPPDAIDEISALSHLRSTTADTPRIVYFIFFPESTLRSGGPLEDRRVRQALNHAVNVDSIVKFALKGRAARVATLFSPLAEGYDATIKPYEYDPARAKKLLAEAMYPNGFTIDMDVPIGGTILKPVEVGQIIAGDLAKVGVQVKFRSLDTATYAQLKLQRKLAPMLLWSWLGFDGGFPLVGNAYSKSPFFQYAGHTPEVDNLVQSQLVTFDPRKRAEILGRLQRAMKDGAPYLPLYQQKDIFGVNRRVQWDPTPGGDLFLRTVSVK